MTRKEMSGERNLKFNNWVREKLPDSSTGFCASDFDFFLWNWKTKKLMILEVKQNEKKIATFQRIMWQNLNRWIKKGIDENWKFYEYHLLTFENEDFSDGKAWLDGYEITEKEAIEYFSMEYNDEMV